MVVRVKSENVLSECKFAAGRGMTVVDLYREF